jgi:hypothetical protein
VLRWLRKTNSILQHLYLQRLRKRVSPLCCQPMLSSLISLLLMLTARFVASSPFLTSGSSVAKLKHISGRNLTVYFFLQIVPASAIPDGWMGLDIGPDSIAAFNAALETTQTVIWNGPMGVFEYDKFAIGTEVKH